MSTRTMAMSMIKDGGEPGIAAPAPLFASSWVALFLQLRHNLETLRASNEDALHHGNTPKPDPRPLDRGNID